MRIKKLGALLSLFVLLAIGQTTFIVDPASAGHNCWRPPYHCFLAVGTYETSNSVANASPAGSPSVILVENNPQTASGNPSRRVFVYTTQNPTNKMEVELAEDAKEYYEHLEKEHGITKAQGFMVLSKEKGEKLRLVEFFPADLEDLRTSKPISPTEALKNCTGPLEHYMSLLEDEVKKK